MKILALIAKIWLYAAAGLAVICLFFIGMYFLYGKSKNCYSVENGKVFYKSGTFPNYSSREIKAADPTTFQVIKYPYAKDKNHVYLQGYVIEECNPETVKLLNFKWRYIQDDQHVFYHRSKLSNEPENFVIIRDRLAKDSRQVFVGGTTLSNADPNTFEDIGNKYTKDKNQVYFSIHVVEGANPTTFTLVPEDKELGRDGDKLFREGQPIDNQYKRLSEVYTIDSKHVMFKEQILSGADPKTFQVVPCVSGYDYAKDANSVYLEDRVIEEADPTSFEIVGEGYRFTKDARFAFYKGKKIEGAHGPSFEEMDMFPEVGRDRSFAYNDNGKKIEGINGANLRRLSEEYATDGVKVIYRGEIIPEADGATFKMANPGLNGSSKEGSDKNHTYRYGERVAQVAVE